MSSVSISFRSAPLPPIKKEPGPVFDPFGCLDEIVTNLALEMLGRAKETPKIQTIRIETTEKMGESELEAPKVSKIKKPKWEYKVFTFTKQEQINAFLRKPLKKEIVVSDFLMYYFKLGKQPTPEDHWAFGMGCLGSNKVPTIEDINRLNWKAYINLLYGRDSNFDIVKEEFKQCSGRDKDEELLNCNLRRPLDTPIDLKDRTIPAHLAINFQKEREPCFPIFPHELREYAKSFKEFVGWQFEANCEQNIPIWEPITYPVFKKYVQNNCKSENPSTEQQVNWLLRRDLDHPITEAEKAIYGCDIMAFAWKAYINQRLQRSDADTVSFPNFQKFAGLGLEAALNCNLVRRLDAPIDPSDPALPTKWVVNFLMETYFDSEVKQKDLKEFLKREPTEQELKDCNEGKCILQKN